MKSTMILSRGATSYTLNSPQYGYESEIHMALQIGDRRAGYRSPRPCFDRGTEWDYRVFSGNTSLPAAQQKQLLDFVRLDAEARGKDFQLNTNAAFHPFGPDLCAYTRFPCKLVAFEPGGVGQTPWLHTETQIRLSLVRSMAVSLPAETRDGPGALTIGPVENLRFPPSFFDSETGYGITNVLVSGGDVAAVDRTQVVDVWGTTVDVVASLGLAAKLVNYLVAVARGNEFQMSCGAGSYAFGADLANADGSGIYTVQLVDPTIIVTHVAHNVYSIRLKLECRLFGDAPSESSFSASQSLSSASGSKSLSSASGSASLSSYSISSEDDPIIQEVLHHVVGEDDWQSTIVDTDENVQEIINM